MFEETGRRFRPKGRTPLAKALRVELGTGKGRKGALGLVEVKCLGVCPKGAVTVIVGNAPGAWAIVPECTQVSAILEELGLRTIQPA